LKFPAVILDPIDGTRELVKGLGECALSLGVFASPRLDDPKNWGWICNPFSGFSIDSSDPMFAIKIKEEGPVSGLVSRSEWNKGLYKNLQRDDLQIYPRGSIAFKLGLLASNACDFIISLAPKNIWDIAGGTLLAHSRGFKLYAGGVEVVELSQATYQPPLLWCRPQHFSQLKEALRI
jgi:myo-inositol-1(or 4)-monophosphatase